MNKIKQNLKISKMKVKVKKVIKKCDWEITNNILRSQEMIK